MRRWFSLALIVSMVLASCDTGEPPTADWCYTYDFTVAVPDNIIINQGDWIPGVGLVTENDALQMAFIEPLYIEPLYFTIHVGRKEGVEGDISIVGTASVFGLDRAVNEVLPGAIPAYPKTYTRDSSDPAGEAGNTVSANIQTNDGIVISQLDLGGMGASPFGTSPCEEPTPTPPPSETPDAGTATPSGTPTLTNTPTATNTPTPSPTPVCFPDTTYDFTISDHGWTDRAYQSRPFGNWITGVGWQAEWGSVSGQSDMRLYLRYLFPEDVSIDEITATFDITGSNGSSQRAVSLGSLLSNGTTFSQAQSFPWSLGNNQTLTVGVGYSIRQIHFTFTGGAASSGQNQITLKSIYINGTCSSDTPTPTFTPSHTPTATTTPTATITQTPNLTASPTITRTPVGGGTGTPSRTPTRTPLAVYTWTPVNTNTALPSSTPIPSLPPPTAIPTEITVTPQTYTPENTSTPNPVTSTPFGTPGGTPWGTPVAWGTPWGTPNGTAIVAGTGLPDMRLTPEYGPVYGFLSTAAAEVNSIPGQISGYIPQVDPGPLFGYVKWAASCVSAQELVGQTLSPILCHTIVGVGLNLILAAIFMSVRVVRLFIKIVNWIMKQILRVIPTMGG